MNRIMSSLSNVLYAVPILGALKCYREEAETCEQERPTLAAKGKRDRAPKYAVAIASEFGKVTSIIGMSMGSELGILGYILSIGAQAMPGIFNAGYRRGRGPRMDEYKEKLLESWK